MIAEIEPRTRQEIIKCIHNTQRRRCHPSLSAQTNATNAHPKLFEHLNYCHPYLFTA